MKKIINRKLLIHIHTLWNKNENYISGYKTGVSL